LNIRNLPEAGRAGLRLRAARKGHSMEAEARTILAEAVRGETGQPFDPELLQDFISGLFRGKRPRLTDELIRAPPRSAQGKKAVIALDASALLAFLLREPGHERVRELLSEACMSTANVLQSSCITTPQGRQ